jgi:hypothetical protein
MALVFFMYVTQIFHFFLIIGPEGIPTFSSKPGVTSKMLPVGANVFGTASQQESRVIQIPSPSKAGCACPRKEIAFWLKVGPFFYLMGQMVF